MANSDKMTGVLYVTVWEEDEDYYENINAIQYNYRPHPIQTNLQQNDTNEKMTEEYR